MQIGGTLIDRFHRKGRLEIAGFEDRAGDFFGREFLCDSSAAHELWPGVQMTGIRRLKV